MPDVNVVIDRIMPCDPAIPALLKRPYFLLVYVDAPLLVRFRRAVADGRVHRDALESFIDDDDRLRFGNRDSEVVVPNGVPMIDTLDTSLSPAQCHDEEDVYSLSRLEKLSRLRLINKYTSLSDLHAALSRTNFTDVERLRPSWDTYFMSLAKLAAERTNCMKRRVGCVIARNKRVVATGYNGTPSGVKNCYEGGCLRCNGAQSSQGLGLDLCLCLHAEENAIIEAGRERCEGSTLYTNLFPCTLCSKKIVQSGISRIVFEQHYATDEAAESLLRAGDVIVDAFQRDDASETLRHLVLQGK